jgi:hypothetical protein
MHNCARRNTDSLQVGASLAAKKKAELVEAKERTTDNILYYTFVFKAVRISTPAHPVLHCPAIGPRRQM